MYVFFIFRLKRLATIIMMDDKFDLLIFTSSRLGKIQVPKRLNLTPSDFSTLPNAKLSSILDKITRLAD